MSCLRPWLHFPFLLGVIANFVFGWQSGQFESIVRYSELANPFFGWLPSIPYAYDDLGVSLPSIDFRLMQLAPLAATTQTHRDRERERERERLVGGGCLCAVLWSVGSLENLRLTHLCMLLLLRVCWAELSWANKECDPPGACCSSSSGLPSYCWRAPPPRQNENANSRATLNSQRRSVSHAPLTHTTPHHTTPHLTTSHHNSP